MHMMGRANQMSRIVDRVTLIYCVHFNVVFNRPLNGVRRRSRRTFSTHFEIFRRRFDDIEMYFFRFRLQIFRRRRRRLHVDESMFFFDDVVH